MYSAVLMLALTAGSETADFGRGRCVAAPVARASRYASGYTVGGTVMLPSTAAPAATVVCSPVTVAPVPSVAATPSVCTRSLAA